MELFKKQPKNQNGERLQAMRHSTEHILAQTMLELYPGLKMAMGPAIENGFYFDFELPEGVKLSEANFPEIEAEMQKIIKADLPFRQEEISVKEARKLFKGNEYKQEWLDGIEERGEKASVYWTGGPSTGSGFVDLCSGPHVASTGQIGVFKLDRIAGAYWRGDEKNEMLTRIYGLAFENQTDLDEYLELREQAAQRDHRKLGKELGIYGIYPEIGAGLPVWLPNGYRIRRTLEDYMIEIERGYGYEHILTPHIGKDVLFETSGHLDFYKESMYTPMIIDNETYYLKPMNCPMGIVVYNSEPHSYRELPLKVGEFGTVYRYEKSGELSGLSRVRGFTQNDAHIICTPEQLIEQFLEVFEMLEKFYQALGLTNYKYRLGLGDPEKEKFKYCGTPEDWVHAEDTIRQALNQVKVDYYEEVGEATFYGPKLDVQATDPLGREESISTIQIDFNLPERFKMTYIDTDGQEKQPFVIHRALIGSYERFLAFLIEFYGGNFPVWLAPLPVIIIPITEKEVGYAQTVTDQLKKAGIRSKVDSRSEPMQAKIRDAELQKIPYMAVVGEKEAKAGTVSIRFRQLADGEQLKDVSMEELVGRITQKIQNKSLEL